MILKKIKDKNCKKKGGQSQVYDISCGKCSELVFVYQKDGKGNIHRCYLDRILAPEALANIEKTTTIKKANDIPNLACPKCDEVIGVPIERNGKRYCFRMRHGYFHKKYTKFEVR